MNFKNRHFVCEMFCTREFFKHRRFRRSATLTLDRCKQRCVAEPLEDSLFTLDLL